MKKFCNDVKIINSDNPKDFEEWDLCPLLNPIAKRIFDDWSVRTAMFDDKYIIMDKEIIVDKNIYVLIAFGMILLKTYEFGIILKYLEDFEYRKSRGFWR